MLPEKLKKACRENCLLLSILAGVALGCVVGVSIHDVVQSSKNPSPQRLAMYVKFPGELFIRMLKMVIVPLVTSSVIVALTENQKASAGQLGRRTMIYYLSTTVFSAILGLVLGKIISPGSVVNPGEPTSEIFHGNIVDSFLDLFR